MSLTDARLDAFRRQTDPPADDLIAALVAKQGPHATRKLFDLLINRLELPREELPASINAFIDAERTLPAWADPKTLRASESLFLDHGPKFLLFLYFKSLPTLYACANGAEVLVRTGRLQQGLEGLDRFSRRVAETGQFMLEVMAPGGIATGGPAVDTVLRVRLIHSAIRHFIGSGVWDEALGRPINQEDMAITLLTFSVSVLDGLRRFKIREAPEREEAYLHHWKVIGHLLGMDPTLLPENLSAGRQLLAQILARQAASSEAGRILGAALIDFGKKAFKQSVVHRTAHGFIHYLNESQVTAPIGFNKRRGLVSWLVPRAAASWFRIIEVVERVHRPLALFLDVFSRSIVHHMVRYFDEYKERPLQLAPGMIQNWGLHESTIQTLRPSTASLNRPS